MIRCVRFSLTRPAVARIIQVNGDDAASSFLMRLSLWDYQQLNTLLYLLTNVHVAAALHRYQIGIFKHQQRLSADGTCSHNRTSRQI